MVRIEESAVRRATALLACDEALKNLSDTDKKRVIELLRLSVCKAATPKYVVSQPVRRFR